MTLSRRDTIKTALAAVATSALAIPAPAPTAATAADLRAVLGRLNRDTIPVHGLMDLSPRELMSISAAAMVWGAMPLDAAQYEQHRHTPLGELRARGIVTAEEWEAATRDAFHHLNRIDRDRLGAFSVTIVR